MFSPELIYLIYKIRGTVLPSFYISLEKPLVYLISPSLIIFLWYDQLKVTKEQMLLSHKKKCITRKLQQCSRPSPFQKNENNQPTNTHSLWRLVCIHFPLGAIRQKVVHSGNGATRNTICSGGRPLCCHLHAWTAVNDRHTTWRLQLLKLLAVVAITLYSANGLTASFMNTACFPRVQLPESIWMYWTPTYESNHKVYIQEQGYYGHLEGAVKITLVICGPGSKQSGNIWG